MITDKEARTLDKLTISTFNKFVDGLGFKTRLKFIVYVEQALKTENANKILISILEDHGYSLSTPLLHTLVNIVCQRYNLKLSEEEYKNLVRYEKDLDCDLMTLPPYLKIHAHKGNNMFDQLFNTQMKNAYTKNLFSQVDNLAWDLMSNSVAIINAEKELTSFDKENSCVSISAISSFSIPLPGFAQATKLTDVKVGDILVQDGEAVGWIIELKTDKEKVITRLKYMRPTGNEHTFTPPKINNPLTGTTNTVMISRDLGGLLGNENNVDSFKSMLMPMMMMGKDQDMSRMLPMMLMSAQSGTDNNMMQMMLMQQMMK